MPLPTCPHVTSLFPQNKHHSTTDLEGQTTQICPAISMLLIRTFQRNELKELGQDPLCSGDAQMRTERSLARG